MKAFDELRKKAIDPASKFSRRLNAFVIFMASLPALLAFLRIQFDLCSNNACESLKETDILFELSPFYLIYSVCGFIVCHFILKKKDLESIYSISITWAVACGFMLISMAPIMINSELKEAHNKALKQGASHGTAEKRAAP